MSKNHLKGTISSENNKTNQPNPRLYNIINKNIPYKSSLTQQQKDEIDPTRLTNDPEKSINTSTNTNTKQLTNKDVQQFMTKYPNYIREKNRNTTTNPDGTTTNQNDVMTTNQDGGKSHKSHKKKHKSHKKSHKKRKSTRRRRRHHKK